MQLMPATGKQMGVGDIHRMNAIKTLLAAAINRFLAAGR